MESCHGRAEGPARSCPRPPGLRRRAPDLREVRRMAAVLDPTKIMDYQMYIGGEWVDAENGAVSEVVDPSTEDGDRASTQGDHRRRGARRARRARGVRPRPVAAAERGGARRPAARGGGQDPRARRGARPPREPADGQALLRGDRGHGRHGPHLRLLRRPRPGQRRRDAQRAGRDDEHGRARARRRHRRHHAVELPDADGGLEGGPVAGRRQRDDPQAGDGEPADQPRAGEDLRGGRPPRGRLPGRHRLRRRDRRLPRRPRGRRHGRLHRLGRGRQAHHAQGRRQREEGRPRAGRQEPQHRVRRRRLRGRHRRCARSASSPAPARSAPPARA